MKIWFDTEFIEDGRIIDLISIGMVREDGETLYLQNRECDFSRASEWVSKNVIPHLHANGWRSRRAIAEQVVLFAGPSPEFWAYFADYDWVVLCQLYGTMMDLPESWPMFCMDVQQERARLGHPDLPPQTGTTHNALQDALWCKDAWEHLQRLDTPS